MSNDGPDLHETLAALFKEVEQPARLLELYYWSLDPSVTSVIRFFMKMKPDVRDALHAFYEMASPVSVNVQLSAAGQITLSCPEVAQTLALVRNATAPARRNKRA